MRNRIRKTLIVIFTIYNLLGTVTICSSYGGDPLYGDWVMPLSAFTFPITFFSFCYRYFSTDIYPVFIIQCIIQIVGVLFILLFTKDKNN